jgi:hypothetical protein
MTNLALGYAAELARIPFTYPIEVVATYIQTNTETRSIGETVRRVYRGEAGGDGRGGLGAFWRGISAYFLVAARPAISIGIFDQVSAPPALPPSRRCRLWACIAHKVWRVKTRVIPGADPIHVGPNRPNFRPSFP